jgi:hypothetical protein
MENVRLWAEKQKRSLRGPMTAIDPGGVKTRDLASGGEFDFSDTAALQLRALLSRWEGAYEEMLFSAI